jgi:hypothetical protein
LAHNTSPKKTTGNLFKNLARISSQHKPSTKTTMINPPLKGFFQQSVWSSVN